MRVEAEVRGAGEIGCRKNEEGKYEDRGSVQHSAEKDEFSDINLWKDVEELHFSPSLQESITSYGLSLRSSEAQLFVL